VITHHTPEPIAREAFEAALMELEQAVAPVAPVAPVAAPPPPAAPTAPPPNGTTAHGALRALGAVHEPGRLAAPLTPAQHRAIVRALAPHWREGQRHRLALALAGALAHAGAREGEVVAVVEGLCGAAADGETADRLAAVRTTFARVAAGETASGWPALAELVGDAAVDALRRALDLWGGGAPHGGTAAAAEADDLVVVPTPRRQPPALADGALHGPLGEIVRAVAPYTEAAPAALFAYLAAFIGADAAAAIGREPFRELYDLYTPRGYFLLVGPSGRGRKDTAANLIRTLLEEAGIAPLVIAGANSAEALIRDLHRLAPEDEPPTGGLFPRRVARAAVVRETEFGRLLTLTQRQGETLSAVLRAGFDSTHLRTSRADGAVEVLDVHLALVGHVPTEELQRLNLREHLASGLLNRHLPIWTERPHVLAAPTPVPVEIRLRAREVLQGIYKYLAAVRRGEAPVPERDAAARALWAEWYPRWSTTQRAPALAQATERVPTYASRLATLFALADRSAVVTAEHLAAGILWAEHGALVWEYLLDETTGDRVADNILARVAPGEEWPWSALYRELAHRGTDAAAIRRALRWLAELGLFEELRARRGERGRLGEYWRRTHARITRWLRSQLARRTVALRGEVTLRVVRGDGAATVGEASEGEDKKGGLRLCWGCGVPTAPDWPGRICRDCEQLGVR
jgi:hypothetical protein